MLRDLCLSDRSVKRIQDRNDAEPSASARFDIFRRNPKSGEHMPLKPVDVADERRLESLVIETPDVLEEGLAVLKHQFITRTGPLDLLCVDSDGRLVVAELKVVEDDFALLQAFRYYDYVNENRDAIIRQIPEQEIRSLSPRLMLVAPSFSENMKTTAKYVTDPQVELFRYHYFELEDGRKELFCEQVEVGAPSVPIESKTIDDLVNYIREESLRALCRKTIKKIQKIGKRIEVKPTQFYIGLLFQGRLVSRISCYREFFDVHYPRDQISGNWEDWDSTRISLEEDLDPGTFAKIETGYIQLGGSPSNTTKPKG